MRNITAVVSAITPQGQRQTYSIIGNAGAWDTGVSDMQSRRRLQYMGERGRNLMAKKNHESGGEQPRLQQRHQCP